MDVDGCGRMWTDVDGCGRVWTHVDGCGRMWTPVDMTSVPKVLDSGRAPSQEGDDERRSMQYGIAGGWLQKKEKKHVGGVHDDLVALCVVC